MSSAERRADEMTTYLGVFVLDGVVEPERLLDEERLVTIEQALIAAGFKPMGTRAVTGDPRGLIVQDHESAGSTSTIEILSSHRDGEPPFRVSVGAFGVGMIRIDEPEPYSREIEERLTEEVGPVIREICEIVVGTDSTGFIRPRPERLLPGGQLLWWHRVVSEAIRSDDDEAPFTLLQARSGAVEAELSNFAHVLVGDGFTFFDYGRAGVTRTKILHQVHRGLFAATEDWLLADSTNREMRDLLNLSNAENHHSDNSELIDRATGLIKYGHALELYLDDRDRHLSVDRRVVWEAARNAWGVQGELASLGNRVRGVADLLSIVADRRLSVRDVRRNSVLFAIAVVTALQSLMLLIDFAVSDDLTLNEPVRAAIASLLFVSGGGLLVWLGFEVSARLRARR